MDRKHLVARPGTSCPGPNRHGWRPASPMPPKARRLWKKFQQVMALPERDRRAVIRLVNSLVTAKVPARGRAPRRATG